MLVPAAMAAGSALGHALQLASWHRAGLVRLPAVLRAHLVHALIGGSFFAAGHVGARYGHSPLGSTLWGLSALLPVAGFWLAQRRHVPAFMTATAHGLVPARFAPAAPRSASDAVPPDVVPLKE
jgi:hypothetical protein